MNGLRECERVKQIFLSVVTFHVAMFMERVLSV
jgi:hypothetical protein